MRSKGLCGFALIVFLVFGWGAAGSNGVLTTKEPQDFYGFLTDAFLAGQTYLKVTPNPALLNLANPWAGAQGIPRLHDASYFHGRYYIYFGPPPVLLLLLPWRLLTGTFLAQGVATLVFGATGTLLAAALLLQAWRRWFSSLAVLWLWLGFGLLVFATRALVLVEDSSVYQVPITCAFFCLMAALNAATWAGTRRGRPATAGLALASIAWGLAVSSRPDYFFSLLALAIPVADLVRREWQREDRERGRCLRLLLAALVPAGIIGAGIAAYNYVRFGEIGQFGMKYQFTAGDQRFLKFFSPESLPGNLERYFLSRPFYTPYFPYITPGQNWGLFFCTPFIALIAVLPFTFSATLRPVGAGWRTWSLTLLAALIPNFLLLSMLAIANERYFLDFAPLAVLLSAVTAWCFLDGLRRHGPRFYRPAQVLVGTLGVWTITQGAMMGALSNGHPESLQALARGADQITALVERARGIKYGPWVVDLRFPAQLAGAASEPLLVSGNGADILYVEYPGPGLAKIGFFHTGSGGPTSAPFPIVPGRLYRLRIDLGSLYPPKDHPLLARWPATLADVLLHRLNVTLDGRPILQGAVAFYPTYPGDLHLGQNPTALLTAGKFTGELRTVAREGVPSPDSIHGPAGEGPVRLVVHMPPYQTFLHEPLISTGHRGAGDLLYVAYVAPGLVRLGIDSWGSGGLETAPLPYNTEQDQVIEADMGSLWPGNGSRQVGKLSLRFNGRLAMFTERPFNPSPAAEVVFGFNGCDSSTSAASFSGTIVRTERIPSAGPPPAITQGEGPIQLVLRFPQDHVSFSQPLLATGRQGVGDLVFVRYIDDHRLSIGYSHAGEPSVVGRPLLIDYGATHAIEISLGSLYPATGDAGWGGIPDQRREQAIGTISVAIDGQPALLASKTAFPASNREVAAGRNSVGAPDCETAFTGTLFFAQRLPVAGLMGTRDAALVPDVQDGIGPIQLALRFPTNRIGRAEPLLVTGRTGAGDVVYVRYLDAHHVSIGYDHWNAGGPLSPPIAVDYASTHLIEASLGSLYPDAKSKNWRQLPESRRRQLLATVSVTLDGQSVISVGQTAYPAPPHEINVGGNPIGASTCDPGFTGDIVEEMRIEPKP